MGKLEKKILATGLGLVAALMLSTASFAEDGPDDLVMYPMNPIMDGGPRLDGGPVYNPDDGNSGDDDQGIAVGEPDPNGDGEPDVVIDDGDVITGDDGTGDDGTGDDGTGDDGTGDDGTGDDGTGDDGIGDDGTGDDGTGDDGTGDDVTGDDGTGDDGTGDDGTDDDGTGDDGTGDDVGIIYELYEVPMDCADCEAYVADLPVEAYQMGAMADPVAVEKASPAAKPSAKPRRSASRSTLTNTAAADCLAQHPQLPWMCEWQNGVGQ